MTEEVYVPTHSELEDMPVEQVALLVFKHSQAEPESTSRLYGQIRELERQLKKLNEQVEYESYKREQWEKEQRDLKKYLASRIPT